MTNRLVTSSSDFETAIDNAGIWGRVLSADEILQDAANSCRFRSTAG
jgi:hypothetical protein